MYRAVTLSADCTSVSPVVIKIFLKVCCLFLLSAILKAIWFSPWKNSYNSPNYTANTLCFTDIPKLGGVWFCNLFPLDFFVCLFHPMQTSRLGKPKIGKIFQLPFFFSTLKSPHLMVNFTTKGQAAWVCALRGRPWDRDLSLFWKLSQ